MALETQELVAVGARQCKRTMFDLQNSCEQCSKPLGEIHYIIHFYERRFLDRLKALPELVISEPLPLPEETLNVTAKLVCSECREEIEIDS